MIELKTCPFCGSKAKIIKREVGNPNHGYKGRLFFGCECGKCGSIGKMIEANYMITFTDYTVTDFRKDPILRATEEDKYNNYIEEIKKAAAEAWNKREKNN